MTESSVVRCVSALTDVLSTSMAAASAGYGYPHAPCPLLLCVVCGLLALMMDSVDSNNLIIICKLFRKAAGNNVMADNGMLDPEQYLILSVVLLPISSQMWTVTTVVWRHPLTR